VHFLDASTFGPLMIANGVTLARDTGLPTQSALEVRDALNRGDLLGPEMVATGAILDGYPPIIPLISVGVRTPDEARVAVRQQAAAGVDMIKVYSRLSRDAFLAILDEAKALGLKVVGHVPETVSIEDAAAAGLACSEHFFGFERMIGRLLGGPVRSTYAGMGADAGYFLRLGEVDPQALQGVFGRLRDSGLTVCPTIVTFQAGVHTTQFQSGDFPLDEYISSTVLETWRALWSGQADLPDAIWQSWAKMVRRLNEAGVPLMTGTDLSVPGVIPGFSLHDELAIWQDAGIPAADVLRSATVVPAQFMGLGDRLGSLAEGKTASMVLLRANPLEDIGNARGIEAVFLRGRYFDRAALDRMLKEVRECVESAHGL
jgi:imidazolonepropionase-like amidohydrolase